MPRPVGHVVPIVPADPFCVRQHGLVDGARTADLTQRHQGLAEVAADLRVDFVRLDEAIRELALVAADKARVVELRYFGGLSILDTADVMDISPATVKRHWTFARAWLYRELSA